VPKLPPIVLALVAALLLLKLWPYLRAQLSKVGM
jgi:hypothetical protein